MPETEAPFTVPDMEQDQQTKSREDLDRGFLVICWNDPVNLHGEKPMSRVFGCMKVRAEKHMMEVHNAGKSLLVRETFEKAEHYVHQLQGYGLQATMEREE